MPARQHRSLQIAQEDIISYRFSADFVLPAGQLLRRQQHNAMPLGKPLLMSRHNYNRQPCKFRHTKE